MRRAKLHGEYQVIDKSEQLAKARSVFTLEIANHGNASVSRDPGRSDRAGDAMVIDQQNARASGSPNRAGSVSCAPCR
jgi:hypothetical protein